MSIISNFYMKYIFLASSIICLFIIIFFLKSKFAKKIAFFFCSIHIVISFFYYANNRFPIFGPIFYFFFQIIWFIHIYLYINNHELKSKIYRIIISYPSNWYYSSTLIGTIFLVISSFYYSDIYILISFILGLFSIIQSLYNFNFGEKVNIDLTNKVNYDKITYIPTSSKNILLNNRPLSIFQITDSHIGTFSSIEKLRELCKNIITLNPDLILLTGDYETIETKNNPLALLEAFEPLKEFKGKIIAVLGNHDYEIQYENIKKNLISNGIILLEDDEVIIDTEIGKIQILGTEFYFHNEKNQIEELFRRFPRKSNCILHLTLMHNPLHFKYIPDGMTDLVFSGHLHGGQVGLNFLGINFNIFSIINLFLKDKIPAQGLWGLKTNRLYSHRGTGHYGLPVRIGVSSEQSIIYLYG